MASWRKAQGLPLATMGHQCKQQTVDNAERQHCDENVAFTLEENFPQIRRTLAVAAVEVLQGTQHNFQLVGV